MPKKLGCQRFLKKEEKLFIKGIKKYQKKINLTNFLTSLEQMKKDTQLLKTDLDRLKNLSIESNHNLEAINIASSITSIQ